MADLTFVNYQSQVLRIVFFCLINYLIWSGMLIQIYDYFLTQLRLSLASPRIASPEVWLPRLLRKYVGEEANKATLLDFSCPGRWLDNLFRLQVIDLVCCVLFSGTCISFLELFAL